ncbi:MAG TPA: hypothetical protein VLE91_04955 [Candidatus Saccharimonadales bacterium]|nr:hypothetical protein [Candidatus Saccharimonadales bacterium]
MIYILHGEDTTSAYDCLTQIQNKYKDHLFVRLESKPGEDEISQVVFTEDLLDQAKLIVAEGFLSPLKKLPKFIEKVPQDQILIFWEKTTLSPAKIKSLSKYAQIEFFKKSSEIFSFLDGLIPGSKNAFALLTTLEEDGLIWQIQNRFLLLLLCKLNISLDQIVKVTKRNLAPWQLDKLQIQSRRFDQKQLMSVYQGSLKIDYLIKSGKTNLDPKTLISVLLQKYL